MCMFVLSSVAEPTGKLAQWPLHVEIASSLDPSVLPLGGAGSWGGRLSRCKHLTD